MRNRLAGAVWLLVLVTAVVVGPAAGAQDQGDRPGGSPAPEIADHHFWVALGDSYSSGEGNPPFDAGTDVSGNRCHRSPRAWPRLLGADRRLACSGATIDDLFGGQMDVGPDDRGQLEQLAEIDASATVDAVTLTIGGNDIPFADVIADCYKNADCALADINTRINNVGLRLADERGRGALLSVSNAARSATVILVGYPRLFPTDYGDVVANCRRPFNAGFGEAEVQRLNSAASRFDRRLRQAAGRAGARYVSVLNALDGHELCTSASWVRPIQAICYPVPVVGSALCGHPWESGSKHGQRALADAVAGPLDSNPRRFLKAYLSTWFAGDRAGMGNFAAPQTLSGFTTSPSNYTGFRVNWRPDYCSLGSSGAGGCTFTLLKRGGGSVTYSVGYHEINRLGHLVIDSFDRR